MDDLSDQTAEQVAEDLAVHLGITTLQAAELLSRAEERLDQASDGDDEDQYTDRDVLNLAIRLHEDPDDEGL